MQSRGFRGEIRILSEFHMRLNIRSFPFLPGTGTAPCIHRDGHGPRRRRYSRLLQKRSTADFAHSILFLWGDTPQIEIGEAT